MFNPNEIFDVVVDVIGDFASTGKIVEAPATDPITGEISTPGVEHNVNYVIEQYPASSLINDKILNGDAKLTLTGQLDIKESYNFIDYENNIWNIITVVKTGVVNLEVMYELQIRK